LAETGRGHFHTEVGKLQQEIRRRVRAGLITSESQLIEETRLAYEIAATRTGTVVNAAELDAALISNLGVQSETYEQTRRELARNSGPTTVTEESIDRAFTPEMRIAAPQEPQMTVMPNVPPEVPNMSVMPNVPPEVPNMSVMPNVPPEVPNMTVMPNVPPEVPNMTVMPNVPPSVPELDEPTTRAVPIVPLVTPGVLPAAPPTPILEPVPPQVLVPALGIGLILMLFGIDPSEGTSTECRPPYCA
jgi:hypothetical protein